MRRSWRASSARPLAVTILAMGVCFAASGCTDDDRGASSDTTSGEVTQPVETTPPPPTTTPEAPAPPPPTPTPQQPPPADVPFSWSSAGALVWHETDVEPTALGQTLRAAGFGWVAVYLHDGLVEDPVEADWVYRFRLASGLPVGGWGVLRTEPEQEAALAEQLLERYSLDFYIANPEVEYEFSGESGPEPRAKWPVAAFRLGFQSSATVATHRGFVVLPSRSTRHRLDVVATSGLRLPTPVICERRGRRGRAVALRRGCGGVFPA